MIDFLWKQKRSQHAFFVSLILLLIIIFYLYDLDWAVLQLCLGLFLLVYLIYLVLQSMDYRKGQVTEQEFIQLQSEFQAYRNQQIQSQNDLEDYFLMWVHQIKTPIAASHMLLDQSSNENSGLKKQLIQIENYANMAMNYLKLNDPSRDMDLSPVKVDDLVRPLLKRYRLHFIEKNIKLAYQVSDQMVVTEAKLAGLMIEQILNNALKYSQGGQISIFFDATSQVLSIKDQGPGIPSQDLPKIFDRGYSGFNGKLEEKSSGLGLYLVALIAKRLGHQVTVESELGQGSQFNLSFKAANLSIM